MGQDHVGLTVRSAQEAADFLIEHFDCVFDWEVKRGPTPTAGERGWSKLFNVHEDSYMPHVLMVKCGDHHLAQYVELFEWASPDQKQHSPLGWPKFSDIGHSYISFTVKDIHATLAYIKTHLPEVRIIQDPPMEFPLRGETCTSTFIVTPFNMWIELAQWSISGPQGTVLKSLREKEGEKEEVIQDEEASECDGATTFHPDIGKEIHELETPAFILDLDKFEQNAQLMRERIFSKRIEWRPPVKAHKCPELAKRLLKMGAVGVITLKISEAETFATHGIDDIMIANEVVSSDKIRRLANLKKRVKRLRVIVDNEDNIRQIAQQARSEDVVIELLVDIDVNMHRCGVLPDKAPALAKLIHELEGVKFMGIMGYEGHTPVLAPEDKTRETKASHELLRQTKELIEAEGIPVEVVSGGGSSNYIDALNTGVLTEIQAGGAAISDILYVEKAGLGQYGHQFSAFVLTQIMSHPVKERAMGDAGFKSMGWHPFAGLPRPALREDIEVYGLSAEHTKFRVKEEFVETADISVGDKDLLVPGYLDPMGMLHRRMYAVREGRVEDVWGIEAAGDLQ